MLRLWIITQPKAVQWLLLVMCATVFALLLRYGEVPAADFLGPMLAGIVFGVMGSPVQVNRQAYQFSVGLVGALVAHSITLEVLQTLLHDWPLMLAATVLTVLLSLFAGLLMAWLGRLPANSSLWGTAPGAAPVMMSMSENAGADLRLVATMQYVRLVCVIATSAVVSHYLAVPEHASANIEGGLQGPLFTVQNIVLSLLLVLLGVVIGVRIPAGLMLCPLVLGVLAQLSGAFEISLPAELMALAYALIGCYVGLHFDRATLSYVIRKLPAMLTTALGLIALCALSAWLFAVLLNQDYLSVFLATSPGGLDSLSIIALESDSDVGFVVAMQTLRLFGVVLMTPPLVKLCLHMLERHNKA